MVVGVSPLPFLPTWDGVKGPLGREGVCAQLGELQKRPWRSAGEPTTSKHDFRPHLGHARLPGERGDDSLDLRVGWKLRQAQATNENSSPRGDKLNGGAPRLPILPTPSCCFPWGKRERAGTHRGNSQGPTFSRFFIYQNRPCHKKQGPFPQKYDFAKRKILLA